MVEMKELNPANRAAKAKEETKRIPMSTPVQKLHVEDIPGYHLHWMRNSPDRIAQAQRAGYEFVRPEEIYVNSVGLGTQSAISGNTDMGSLVSVIAGGVGADNQPTRLVLMKLKQEYWEEDQKKVEQKNDQVVAALNGGQVGGAEARDGSELNMRYVGSRTKLPDMFTKKIRK